MNRREALIALLALGASTRAGLVAAQRPNKMRRIGVLMGYAESDAEAQARLAVFKERLTALGWTENGNLIMEVRWSAGDVGRAATLAKKLVAMQPEVILASPTPVTAALQKEALAIPVVFTVVADPIGSGFVKSLAHPGGNMTGFINIESSLIEKWLELLREAAPRVTRVAVMFNPDTAPYAEYYLRPVRMAASKLGVTVSTATVRSESDIRSAIAALARRPDSGLILINDSFLVVNRKTVIESTAYHRVPAMYFAGFHVQEGGLISYGVQVADLFRRAAPIVDRILRGAKPSDLPVEQPTKFELAVNMKTAKALGIKIPQSILVRADMVIK